MHGNKKNQLLLQVKRLRARFAQTLSSVWEPVMHETWLMQVIEQEVRTYRERLYGPLSTLMRFVEQVLSADKSCQDAVARGLSQRVALGQSPSSLYTGAYCKARARLPLALPARLAQELGERLCANQRVAWRWRGREVKLADGTTVSMPDTRANQEHFPQPDSQQPGCGFPIARLVAIVSLSGGVVLAWALAPWAGKHTGETALFWTLKHHFRPGDIVIADRCYTSFFIIAALAALGVDVVFRQHASRPTDFRRGARLGARDHCIAWERPTRPGWMDEATYAQMPERLPVREARVGGYILVTTLLNPRSVSKDELLALYRQRWHLELDLRAIKTVMQMDVLRGKTPGMVEKEIAVHFLAYNLVRLVMAQAAAISDQRPRELSFKAALQLLNAFEVNLRHGPEAALAERCAILHQALARCRLPDRPNRVEPRAVKRRPRWTRWLQQPRHTLRARLYRRQERRQRAA